MPIYKRKVSAKKIRRGRKYLLQCSVELDVGLRPWRTDFTRIYTTLKLRRERRPASRSSSQRSATGVLDRLADAEESPVSLLLASLHA